MEVVLLAGTIVFLALMTVLVIWVAVQLAKRYGWWNFQPLRGKTASPPIPRAEDVALSAEIWELLHGPNIVRGEWLSGGPDVHLRVTRLGVGEVELERVDSSAFTDRMPGTVLTAEVMRVTQGMIAIRAFTREVTVGSARVVPRPQEQIPADARRISGADMEDIKQQLGRAKLW